MTNWYQLPHKTVRDLILIILRSSIVIKITAGKIFHMSIPTFGDVSVRKFLTSTINWVNVNVSCILLYMYKQESRSLYLYV